VRFSCSRRVRTPYNQGLPPKHPMVAHECCVADTQSNSRHTTRSFYALPSLVPLSVFATDIFLKLQADSSPHANLFRFANLVPTFSYHARPESRRLASHLARGAIFGGLRTRLQRAAWVSSLTSSMNTVTPSSASRFVASSASIPSSRMLSTLRSLTACVSYRLSVEAMRGAF
jgi:hypothetical protein